VYKIFYIANIYTRYFVIKRNVSDVVLLFHLTCISVSIAFCKTDGYSRSTLARIASTARVLISLRNITGLAGYKHSSNAGDVRVQEVTIATAWSIRAHIRASERGYEATRRRRRLWRSHPVKLAKTTFTVFCPSGKKKRTQALRQRPLSVDAVSFDGRTSLSLTERKYVLVEGVRISRTWWNP